MNSVWAVLKKEWLCFRGADRGVFILYLVLVISWSFLIVNGSGGEAVNAGALWLVFFSVVITANFSNSVFISERVSGALEILITSGLSRTGILLGKMIFVLSMSLGIGLICMSLGLLWQLCGLEYSERLNGIGDFMTFAASAYMNVACSAFLSVRMANPRLLHFANLFLMGLIVGLHSIMVLYFPLPDFLLPFILVLLGVVFTLLAKREFQGERILQSVIF